MSRQRSVWTEYRCAPFVALYVAGFFATALANIAWPPARFPALAFFVVGALGIASMCAIALREPTSRHRGQLWAGVVGGAVDAVFTVVANLFAEDVGSSVGLALIPALVLVLMVLGAAVPRSPAGRRP